MTHFGWIAVDLDGTLAEYDHWRGIDHICPPIPLMVERVKRWRAEGKEVRIFTARVDGGELAQDVEVVRHHIEQWCIAHIGECLPITNVKDYGMVQIWDDRAVCVEKNTGRILGEPLP